MTAAINEPRYSFEPSDFQCRACDGDIVAESSFYSAIFFEGETFLRRSFCMDCWKKSASPAAGAYAYWRSRRPAPQAAPGRLQFDPVLIFEFFKRLGEDGSDGRAGRGGEDGADGEDKVPATAPATVPANRARGEKIRLRLVLALLLIRRKYLIFESAAMRNGQEWLKLSEKADPERIYYVENPPLSDAQLDAVKVSLGELLHMEI